MNTTLRTHRVSLSPRLLLCGALFAGWALLPSLALAQQPGAEAEKPDAARRATGSIPLLLSAYHTLPERELFEAASTDPQAELLTLASDRHLFPAHRYRALDALGAYWPTKSTEALYVSLLEKPESAAQLHQLLMLTARHFPAQAPALLAPVLQHEDEQLRLTATAALGLVNSSASREVLRAALRTERSELVRQRIEAMLVEIR